MNRRIQLRDLIAATNRLEKHAFAIHAANVLLDVAQALEDVPIKESSQPGRYNQTAKQAADEDNLDLLPDQPPLIVSITHYALVLDDQRGKFVLHRHGFHFDHDLVLRHRPNNRERHRLRQRHQPLVIFQAFHDSPNLRSQLLEGNRAVSKEISQFVQSFYHAPGTKLIVRRTRVLM